MKKHLLATTALVIAGLIVSASPANAQQNVSAESQTMGARNMEVTVGGYSHQFLGFNDQDDDTVGPTGTEYQSIDIQGNTEVHIMADATHESGVNFGLYVEFDGERDFTQVDRSYVYAQGNFGRFMIGSLGSAQYQTHFVSPNVGIKLNADSESSWEGGDYVFNWIVPTATFGTPGVFATLIPGQVALNATPISTTRFGDDFAQKIVYMSPRFGHDNADEGFQVGISYAPDVEYGLNGAGLGFNTTNPNALQFETGAHSYEDAFSVGANYDGTIGSVDLGVSLGYEVMDATTAGEKDPRFWNAGLNVGYGGFTFGAAYGKHREGITTTFAGPVTNNSEGHSWDLGLSYESGPFGVSVNYFRGEVEGDVATLGDDETEAYAISGMYKLGSGVDLVATLGHAEYDDEVNESTLTAGSPAVDNEGTFLVTGIRVQF